MFQWKVFLAGFKSLKFSFSPTKIWLKHNSKRPWMALFCVEIAIHFLLQRLLNNQLVWHCNLHTTYYTTYSRATGVWHTSNACFAVSLVTVVTEGQFKKLNPLLLFLTKFPEALSTRFWILSTWTQRSSCSLSFSRSNNIRMLTRRHDRFWSGHLGF